jgi:hypothetical protein
LQAQIMIQLEVHKANQCLQIPNIFINPQRCSWPQRQEHCKQRICGQHRSIKRRAEECNNNDTVDLRTILKVPCYIHGASILQSHNAGSME